MAEPQTLDPRNLPRPKGPVALIASTYNLDVVRGLVTGAEAALQAVGAEILGPIWVPGALEISLAGLWVAEKNRPSALVALGCIIRGETFHFDLVAQESARGVTDVSLKTGLPFTNAILACDTLTQALERSSPGEGNKGYEAAAAAVAMAALCEKLN